MKDDKLSNNKMYKNIGVDVDFVAKMANQQNDRMNKMYWERTEGPNSAMAQKVAPAAFSQQPQFVPQQQSFAAPSVDLSALRAELMAIVDQKINDLAGKMQSYANETDGKLNTLHNMLANSHTQHAPQQNYAPQQHSAPPQQHSAPAARPQSIDDERRRGTDVVIGAPSNAGRPLDGGAAAGKLAQQNALDPETVSIQKMFNFSNSKNGKFMR